jgi:uncharacterized ParB-like nuclease family protein/FtsZ-binding cell division protein ZapB
MKALNLSAIVIDKGTQSRAQISEETVSDYAEAMQAGDQFPPIIVFFDGVDYYLADGFHRLHAAQRLGKASIQAEVRTGTLRDAILFSLGANDKHGLRRSNADKRKCVRTLLEDFEWGELSVNEMARICCVSPQLVAAVKSEMDGGTKVSSVNFNAPKKAKPVKLNNVIEPPEEPAEKDEAVAELLAENQRLADRLAVEAMEATPEEKLAATETIAELREQIRILEIENQSLKISRDTFQRENSELKKTVASLQRKLKKEE